jgi:hypothetical protein
MASGRVAISFFSRHTSIADNSGSCQRMPICVPRPVVGGLPRFFFGVPRIDLLINMGYHKSRPKERLRLSSGPNLNQGYDPWMKLTGTIVPTIPHFH